MQGKSQKTAAAVAAMSERSARTWEQGPLPSESKQARAWRTRVDPFAESWQKEIVPLLRADTAGVLEAKTMLDVLMERHPERYDVGHLRTLQRRVRQWRAVHGPVQPVYFEQRHEPGREASIDFTHASDLGVTIAGEVFRHLLFHFVLSFSGWTYVALALSETMEALLDGVQGALFALGGVPGVLRSDNLSAATHELAKSRGRGLTHAFQSLLSHYGLQSTRIRPGESHENGVAEQCHRRVKSALEQALVLRGHRDFPSEESYLAFVRQVVDAARNRIARARLDEERAHLRPLPSCPLPNYATYEVRVRKWSTMRVRERTYSVPSRLIGHIVSVRLFARHLEVRVGDELAVTLPRIVSEKEQRIDYRHIIWSLVRKPGAFARYRYREELFPSVVFRRAYDALSETHKGRADVEYVRLLHLAASTSEAAVARVLWTRLEAQSFFDYASVKAELVPRPSAVPDLRIGTVDLHCYDALLQAGAR